MSVGADRVASAHSRETLLEERTASSPPSSPYSAVGQSYTSIPTESQRLRACPKPVPPAPRMALAEFTDANFGDEVVASKVPVIIVFWSQTCGPC